MMKSIFFFVLVAGLFSLTAQTSPVIDRGGVWMAVSERLSLNNRWTLPMDMGVRFLDPQLKFQQTLYRIGVSYAVKKAFSISGGYAYFFTVSDRITGTGKVAGEHRLWQFLTYQQTRGRLLQEHRFRVEERWIAEAHLPDSDFDYRQQLRSGYRARVQVALNRPTLRPKTLFLTATEETLGYLEKGKVHFDQQRVGVGLGYQFSQQLQGNMGYLLIATWPASNPSGVRTHVLLASMAFFLTARHKS